ncbi:MAG: hypothetical protein AVDCRST_MAG09-1697, partial [uncultured Sphingomonas sp.]
DVVRGPVRRAGRVTGAMRHRRRRRPARSLAARRRCRSGARRRLRRGQPRPGRAPVAAGSPPHRRGRRPALRHRLAQHRPQRHARTLRPDQHACFAARPERRGM